MPVRSDDPRPPYVQVIDDLREQIRTGRLARGAKLPPTRELADAYGIASMTVQHALRQLKEEGLVVSYPRRGIFVSDRAAPAVGGAANASAEPRSLEEALAVLRDVNAKLARVQRERDEALRTLGSDPGPSRGDGPGLGD